MIRYLTAGESHGRALVGIVEGLPANLAIDFDFINSELTRRQGGYGRGGRMAIEKDKAEFLSGIRGGKTTGAPIAFTIENRDFENWKDIVSPYATKTDERKLTAVRPGHADLAGCIKYNQTDARNILERTSARSTASLVVIGSLCKTYLQAQGIKVTSEVLAVGGEKAENKIKAKIDKALEEGDTIGGELKVTVTGMPVGVGSSFSLDGRLEYALMASLGAMQSVKGVLIGNIDNLRAAFGSEFHDAVYIDKSKKIYRKTNNAGGIEGGISNGENIDIILLLKPIPSVPKGIDSIDIETLKPSKSAVERGDATAVEAAAVVAENITAIVMAQKIKEHFGGDHM